MLELSGKGTWKAKRPEGRPVASNSWPRCEGKGKVPKGY